MLLKLIPCCYLLITQDLRYTVTEEVWFDVTIKDYEGPGEDFNGRFVIGLFGKLAPMCSMNFAALAKGYSRPAGKGRKAVSFRIIILIKYHSFKL